MTDLKPDSVLRKEAAAQEKSKDESGLLTPLGYSLFILYGNLAWVLSTVTAIFVLSKAGASFIKPEIYIEANDSSPLKVVVVLMCVWGVTAGYLQQKYDKSYKPMFYFYCVFTFLFVVPWVAPLSVLPDWMIPLKYVYVGNSPLGYCY